MQVRINLFKVRQDAGMTTSDVAIKAGITEELYRGIEAGYADPVENDQWLAIVHALDLPAGNVGELKKLEEV